MTAVVDTQSGKLRGRTQHGVRVFRGIPFAAPPVGPMRFRPPEPVAPWAGVREAFESGPGAAQNTGRVTPSGAIGGFFGNPAARSEDCLTLNIFTPGPSGTPRPVLVWIHGGAFTIGSGSAPIYDGGRLAKRGNCVVVTIHYRLGALGFLTPGPLLPEGPFASNVGVRDQLAALEWVRDNIHGFGGDPARVTVFGESAGGMSVGALLGMPAARGLFARAILQSGATDNVSSPDAGARVAEVFLEEVGLAAADAPRLMDLPTEQILQAQMGTMMRMALSHGNLPWQPTVDGDLIPEDAHTAVAAGAARDVPILVGTNRDEWNLFLIADRKARRLDEAGLLRRYDRALPGESEAAHKAYLEARPDAAPVKRWSAFQTDRVFRLPAERLVEAQRGAGGRALAYAFTWRPLIGGRIVGAAHAVELPLLFGTWRHPFYRAIYNGRGAHRVARTMQRAWTRFAHGEDPEGWSAADINRIGRVGLAPEVGHPAIADFWSRPNARLRDRETGL